MNPQTNQQQQMQQQQMQQQSFQDTPRDQHQQESRQDNPNMMMNEQQGSTNSGGMGGFQDNTQLTVHGGISGPQNHLGNNQRPADQTMQNPSQHHAQHHHESKDTGPPTHVEICKVILGGEGGKMLQEHHVCFDETEPSLALAQIFLSTYLASQARGHAYRVEYEHNCGDHRSELELIQELLPSPLLSPDTLQEGMSVEQLQSFCSLIEENSKRDENQATALEMLLWDTNAQQRALVASDTDRNLEAQPISMLERLAPLVKTNLYQAAMMSRSMKSSLKAGYGVLKGRDNTSEKTAVGSAVIYLPCADRHCTNLVLVPYVSYLMHIPFSTHVIDIVASPECMTSLNGCRKYVEDLASTTRQFIPQMSVEVISAEASSPDVMDRLIEAEHVVCGPGFGMVCLFPALGKEGGRVTLFDVGPDQIEGDSASSFVARLPPDLIQHVNPPTSVFSVAPLTAFAQKLDSVVDFAQRSPEKETGDCRFVRGRYGTWTQDMVYADHAQYRTPLSHYSGNAEKFFRRKAAKGEYGDMKHRKWSVVITITIPLVACPIPRF